MNEFDESKIPKVPRKMPMTRLHIVQNNSKDPQNPNNLWWPFTTGEILAEEVEKNIEKRKNETKNK